MSSLVLLAADASSFTRAGYPTIATVGGTFIFVYTLYYAAAKTGYGGWRNHAVWFFFNLLLWLFGLFLVFGPDQLIGVATPVADPTTGAITYVNNGSSYTSLEGPRAAIIGLQLMVQASVGVFAIYSANAYASLVFAMIGMFNELCLIGSLFFFNYNQPIWLLDPAQCNLYFKALPADNIGRCHDTGYLEFLRIIGTFEILINGFLIVISLLAYATAVPAVYHPANTAAAGTAAPYGGPAAATTAGGYNAGPSYGTATAGPGFVAQGAGTGVAQPTYTTTTQPTYTTTTQPTSTYTTTTTTAAPTTTHL